MMKINMIQKETHCCGYRYIHRCTLQNECTYVLYKAGIGVIPDNFRIVQRKHMSSCIYPKRKVGIALDTAGIPTLHK